MDKNTNTDKIEQTSPQPLNYSNKIEDFKPIIYFKKDKNFIFVHQKLEKLGAAIYMITNFFNGEEPLKWSLRQLGAELLHLNISLQSDLPQSAVESSERMKEVILEIVSLLDIAVFAGLISSMNVSIIKGEFRSVLEAIDSVHTKKTEVSLGLGKEFFRTELVEYPEQKLSEDIHNNQRSIIKDIRKTHTIHSFETSDSENVLNSTQIAHNTLRSSTLRAFSPVAVKKNKRQSIIISLIKRKKEVMIKDVSEVIQDCSEKTLQRELAVLVDEGVLKKEGERRWTKYSFK